MASFVLRLTAPLEARLSSIIIGLPCWRTLRGAAPAMVNLLRDLAVDPFKHPDEHNPVRQVIINTHSPGVVQLVNEDDLLFATRGGGPIRKGVRATSCVFGP
jgi:hypothetical protein